MKDDLTADISLRDRLLDWAWLLLFLALVIVPVMLMKVPSELLVPQAGNGNSGKPLVFLPENQRFGSSAASVKESIYAWMQLKNPFLGLTPDCQYGFRQFVNDEVKRDFEYLDLESALVPLQPKAAPMLSMANNALPRYEGDILLEPLMGINVAMPARTQLAEEEGAFWFDERGRILLNPPEINLVDARRAIAAGPSDAQIRNTALQLMPSPLPDVPARIVVRKSSGNGELDRQAASALRRRLVQGGVQIPAEGL
ncbi:MAG: hypothetical protein J5746_00975, partial [Victivallales bacterium]|nr:hypothetical protein [Victivallales bacterium]